MLLSDGVLVGDGKSAPTKVISAPALGPKGGERGRMSRLLDLIESIENEWREPKRPEGEAEEGGFRLACRFDRTPARGLEQVSLRVPPEMAEFWSICSSALLFVDVDYGQWGLEILNPLEALKETRSQRRWRPGDFNRKSDLVIGRFKGDLDVLILLCDPRDPNYGKVAASDPEYSRSDWSIVAENFEHFLERPHAHVGDKYWHRPEQSHLPKLTALKWGK